MTESNVAKCLKCGAEVAAHDAPGGLCPKCLLLGSATMDGLPPIDELRQSLDRYEALELIGRGGMGAVYKARHKELDRWVAIKVLIVDDTEGSLFAERFRREAQVMAKLDHPNIIKVHDFGTTDGGHYFIAMDFIEGADLHKLIRDQKIDTRQALGIVAEICDALQYAHDQGYVHRDIKPANILIDEKGKVKVGDFGLARILEGVDPEATLTMTGAAMGTPNYIAPEQISQAGRVDRRADIFSLGVMFYEMLTGEVPRGRFLPPSEKAKVDSRLDDVVLRAMDSEPERRYQEASEVRSDVDAIVSGKAGKSAKPSRKSRSTLMTVLLALCGVALLGVVAVLTSIFMYLNVRSNQASAEVESLQLEAQNELRSRHASDAAKSRIQTAREYIVEGHFDSARGLLRLATDEAPEDPDVLGEAILLLHQIDSIPDITTLSPRYFLHARTDHPLRRRITEILERTEAAAAPDAPVDSGL